MSELALFLKHYVTNECVTLNAFNFYNVSFVVLLLLMSGIGD
jgi:hypothetical protein